MIQLISDFRDWFLPKSDYFIGFAEVDSRLEGWFKGEMIMVLRRLRGNGCIDSFCREYSAPGIDGRRKQIDFRIDIQDEISYCELKALCVSQAAGTPRNLSFYFRDDHLGVVKDIKKLDELDAEGRKWVLGFVYPSPDLDQWRAAIQSMAIRYPHWKPVTDPSDFPEFLFLSLWKRD